VNVDDLDQRVGAANVDSACTGTVLREFKCAASLADLPPSVIAKYEDGTEVEGALVYNAAQRD
jgi:hypothetical protein